MRLWPNDNWIISADRRTQTQIKRFSRCEGMSVFVQAVSMQDLSLSLSLSISLSLSFSHTHKHKKCKHSNTYTHPVKHHINCRSLPLTFIDFLVSCCNYYRHNGYNTGQMKWMENRYWEEEREWKRKREKLEEGAKKQNQEEEDCVGVRQILLGW